MHQWFAQSSARPAGEVIVWAIILAAVVAAGGVLILWLRSRMLGNNNDESSPTSLLEELRRSHERGEITQEEFRLARDRVLEGVSGRPRARQKLLRGEVHEDGAIRSRPGFDLLGEPLPHPPDSRQTDQHPDAPE